MDQRRTRHLKSFVHVVVAIDKLSSHRRRTTRAVIATGSAIADPLLVSANPTVSHLGVGLRTTQMEQNATGEEEMLLAEEEFIEKYIELLPEQCMQEKELDRLRAAEIQGAQALIDLRISFAITESVLREQLRLKVVELEAVRASHSSASEAYITLSAPPKFDGDILKFAVWQVAVKRYLVAEHRSFSSAVAAVTWVLGLLDGTAARIASTWDVAIFATPGTSALDAISSVLARLSDHFQDTNVLSRSLREWQQLRQGTEDFATWSVTFWDLGFLARAKEPEMAAQLILALRDDLRSAMRASLAGRSPTLLLEDMTSAALRTLALALEPTLPLSAALPALSSSPGCSSCPLCGAVPWVPKITDEFGRQPSPPPADILSIYRSSHDTATAFPKEPGHSTRPTPPSPMVIHPPPAPPVHNCTPACDPVWPAPGHRFLPRDDDICFCGTHADEHPCPWTRCYRGLPCRFGCTVAYEDGVCLVPVL